MSAKLGEFGVNAVPSCRSRPFVCRPLGRAGSRGIHLVLSLLAVFCALGSFSYATEVSAQTPQLQSPLAPAPIMLTDAAGVDLRSGQRIFSSTASTIGDANAPTFGFSGSRLSEGANTSTPDGYIRSSCTTSPYSPACTDYFLALNLGGRTFYTRGNRGDLEDGSVVINENTVRRKDGSIWEFEGSGSFYSNTTPYQAYLKKITFPDGTVYSYSLTGSGVGIGRTIVTSTGYKWDYYKTSQNTWEIRLTNLACPSCAATDFPLVKGSSEVTNNSGRPSDFHDVQGVDGSPPTRITEIATTRQGLSTVTVVTPAGRTSQMQRPPLDGYFVGSDFSGYDSCAGRKQVANLSTAVGQWTYAYTFDNARTCQPIETVSTDPAGSRTVVAGYPGSIVITDSIGRATTYTTDTTQPLVGAPMVSDGSRVLSVTYPEHNKVEYSYTRANVSGAVFTSKDGSTTQTVSASYPVSCTDANARTCNQPTSITDSRGGTTDSEYHQPSGLVSRVVMPADGQGRRAETRYTYSQLSARYYAVPGQLTTGTPVWKLTQTSTCRTMPGDNCVNTADETRTLYGYDDNLLPNRIEVRAGDGSLVSVTTKLYDAVGNVIATDGPLPGDGDKVYGFYDSNRRRIGQIATNPASDGSLRYVATRYTYDADGLQTLLEEGPASGTTRAALDGMTVTRSVSSGYDGVGRKVVERVQAGGVAIAATQFSYDVANRVVCTAVRMNPAIYGSLPADACALGAEGAQGPDRITKNVYDAAGQLMQVRRAVGTPLEHAYATYAYSPNGQRTDVIDAGGARAQMAYDGFDRQVRWSFPDKARPAAYAPSTPANALATAGAVSASDYEAYGYDAGGNRTSVRRRDGRTLTFGYDALNRMASKIVPDGCALIQAGACPAADTTREVYYLYDLQGHQTSANFDSINGEGVSVVFDALGHKTGEIINIGGFGKTLTYQNDAAGNRTRTTFPDGVAFDQNYDGAGRPRLTQQPGGVVIADAGYDALGRLGTLGKVGATTSFGYDGIGRLTSQVQSLAGNGVTVALGYNPAGQIVSETRDNSAYAFTGYANVDRSYAVNGLDQYTSAGPASFQYDANGNLISDGTTAYGYDAENRLVSASNGTSLRYDPMGRLWQVSGPAGTTRLLYDGDQLSAEYDGGGTLLRRYVHGTGADDPLVWYEGGGLSDRRSLMADHQGSVIAVVDANGNPMRINAYDEYGIPGASNLGRFQYTGQAYIPELGMYHYKARLYSPTLGRFLQTDPIGYQDQINLYAYVGNDPVNRTDPSGTQTAPTAARAACAAQSEACAGVVVGTALIGAATMSASIQQNMIVNGHVNSMSSVPVSDPRARSTITQSTTSYQNRRPESYVVRVQIQGIQVGGNNSTPLAGEMPISGGEVKGAINGLLSGLTSRQQRDVLPAVTGAFRAVDRAITNGGLDAGFQIRGLNKDFSPNEVRVDIEIIKGKNIQY